MRVSQEPTSWVERGLATLRARNRLRDPRAVRPIAAVEVCVEHQTLRLFSSNDYLGLSSHPTVRQAAADAALKHGMGPRGAALVCGHTEVHEELEASLFGVNIPLPIT